ncbi:MAG: hypothetical protein PWQ58_1635 [Archaeoglobaceae archaeon]|nr:hypothetical protein [Archaeoglobaceae archaeon]
MKSITLVELIFGKEGIGKTRLLKDSAKEKKYLYLIADISKNVLDAFLNWSLKL